MAVAWTRSLLKKEQEFSSNEHTVKHVGFEVDTESGIRSMFLVALVLGNLKKKKNKGLTYDNGCRRIISREVSINKSGLHCRGNAGVCVCVCVCSCMWLMKLQTLQRDSGCVNKHTNGADRCVYILWYLSGSLSRRCTLSLLVLVSFLENYSSKSSSQIDL